MRLALKSPLAGNLSDRDAERSAGKNGRPTRRWKKRGVVVSQDSVHGEEITHRPVLCAVLNDPSVSVFQMFVFHNRPFFWLLLE